MTARAEIENTISHYAWGFDSNDMDLLVDCFTEDAEVIIVGEPVIGRDAIRKLYSEGRASRTSAEQPRHLMLNLAILEESEKEARTVCYFMGALATGSQFEFTSLGWYEDRFVNEDGRWRIAYRKAHFDARP
jgi:hypothetical protein